MSKFKKTISIVLNIAMLIAICSALTFSTYAAAPTKPTPTSPGDGQIIPYYEVWLRWNDVSNETFYTVTVRDITISETSAESLVYHEIRVAQNSTYFIIPTTKLKRGHQYRWVVLSNNASGKTCSDSMLFTIEAGTGTSNLNVEINNLHIRPNGFASAQRLEHFIYATTSGYADILNAAAQSWNGISSKVNLVRTGTPTDGKYEIGIFESPSTDENPNKFGHTDFYIGGQNGTLVGESVQYDYAEVQTFRENVEYWHKLYKSVFYIQNINDYLKGNAAHEIGHALSLGHTSCKCGEAAKVYQICHSTKNGAVMPLVLNSAEETGATPNVVDRDHLRIKWGA